MPETKADGFRRILDGERKNFETLCRAATAGDACMAVCRRRSDGAEQLVVCAVNRVEGEFQLVPAAVMIDGNPYDVFCGPEESYKETGKEDDDAENS